MSAEPGDTRLETAIGRVLRVGTIASSVLFALGFVMTLASSGSAAASLSLNVALLTLLATPVARVVVSVVQFIREGDRVFVVLTLVVLLALGGSVVAAYL